ncbi:C4-dicarboxylate transporter DcuC [Campylobacter lari]|uniref:C4-dicarboxylate transporter DcuC n=1 Tax=Campylobacter lari TaxID=201 RepID=UPI0021F7CF69|nr:C4-dicarboxylate transporter DcuC [Campylobacter lari]MCW0184289.1 C4-dicarboxylate transporter DcuC [Campylobacter lari]
MEVFLSVVATLFCVFLVAYFILNKYNPIFTFFLSGIVILIIISLATGESVLKQSLGNPVFDVFGFVTQTFKTNLAGVGLIIMSVAGFAAYMKHINASAKLAFVANKPLGKIKNKYLVLSGTFVVGMALKIVISSYTGLLLLLLASIYPVLITIGIRPITAVSVLSLIALDYGPKDGNSINLADMVGIENVVAMFFEYQIYPVIAYVVVIALLIPFYYSYMDKKDLAKGVVDNIEHMEIKNPNCPLFYIFLPWLPIVFLFCAYFANLYGYKVKLDVVSANFLSISLVFILEYVRHKDAKKLADDLMVILKAMAEIFVSVVCIIIAASIFAEGIKALKGIEYLALAVSSMGASAVLLTIIVLSFIVYFVSVIMGSGIAAFNAFGRLAPDIAQKLGINPVSLALPLEIASCLGRAASPISGGILALAGFAKLDPIAIVKRSTPMLLVGMALNILIAWYFA